MKALAPALTGALLLIAAGSTAEAKLSVFACVPEWGALASAIGGDRLDIKVATTALEDPEKIAATPGMISTLQGVDMLVCTGAQLEASWLPAVLERANNPKVAQGQPGAFYAADFVQLQLDETPLLGHNHKHFHADGNPHIEGDPRNVVKVAAQLAKRLIQI